MGACVGREFPGLQEPNLGSAVGENKVRVEWVGGLNRSVLWTSSRRDSVIGSVARPRHNAIQCMAYFKSPCSLDSIAERSGGNLAERELWP